MSRFASAATPTLLAALLACFSAPSAGDSCVADTPPTPDGNYTCDGNVACPNSADTTGDHYRGGKIVSFGAQSVGACDTPAAYTGIRCEDPRATCDTTTLTCKIKYLGLVYKPATAQPANGYPAVMLITGSSDCSPDYTKCVYQPSVYCAFTAKLLARGYVVFQPLPRGYGFTPTQKSTGLYVGDLVKKQVFRSDGCAFNHPDYPTAACTALDLEDEGHQDVKAGLTYMKGLPYVNASKIAALGYSYGGIRVLALNELDVGLSAVLAPAAASESWCRSDATNNVVLQSQLKADTKAAKSPIFFFQTQNDQNIKSTTELSHAAGEAKHQFQATLFPKAKDGAGDPYTFGDQAHGCFSSEQRSVDIWAPVAFEFLERYGVQ